MSMRLGLVLLLSCGLFPRSFAQDRPAFPPPPSVEPIPGVPPAPVFVVPLFASPGTRDVWKNYGVDYTGRFRPRVVLAPYGSSYYYRDGTPYPFLPSRNMFFRPNAD